MTVGKTSPQSSPSEMASTQPGGLAIVIVNWNSGQFLRDCLASLQTCAGLNRVSQVVVVDNDSRDQSMEDLPALPVPVRLIRNSSNLGFAAACNQGAASCTSNSLLFLNPDSELHTDSLRVPLDYLDQPENADVGICGIQLLDEKRRVGRTCSRLPSPTSMVAMAMRWQSLLPRMFPPHFMKEWDHSETHQVDEVIGAFFLVRRDLFWQLGGFDGRFFVYFEEVDFCERSRQLGYRTMFLATAQADHAGGGCSNQIRARSLFYSLRSRVQYAKKHFNANQARAVSFTTFICEPLIRSINLCFSLKFKNIGQLLYGFSLLWWDRFVEPISSGTGNVNRAKASAGVELIPATMNQKPRQAERSAA